MTLGMPSLDLVVQIVLAAAGVLFVIGMSQFFVNMLHLLTQSAFVAFFGPNLTAKSVANVSPRPPISRPAYISTRAIPNVDSRTQDISAKDDADRTFAGQRQASTTTRPARATRSSRQVKDMSGLPIISRPNPGQAEAGVGGLPVTGALFPPMRAQGAPITSSPPQTRPFKKPSVKGGKPVISRPVLTAQSEEGPLKKITTVDLATAARNERERRGQLEPTQPVDPVKALSQEELRNQAQTFKRKEIGPAIALSANPPVPAAMTTSSSQLLSPRTDELRRRSPRQSRQTLWVGQTPPGPPSASGRQNGAASSISTATSPPELPPRSPLRPKTAQSIGGPIGPVQEASLVRDNVVKPAGKESTAMVQPMRFTAAPEKMRPEKPSGPASRDTVELLVPQVAPLSPRVSQAPALESSGSQRLVHRQLAELSRNGSVRPNIRPSRQRPVSPGAEGEPALPPKTPVQLRSANGIPSNPRARATKTPIREVEKPQDQTVMFTNGARDDVGGQTRGAMDRALSDILKRRPVADHTSPTSSAVSVVHRPRPIPRKSRYSPSSRGSARLNHSPMPLLAYNSPETTPYPLSAGLLGSKQDQSIASQSASEQPASGNIRAQRRRSSSLPDIGGNKLKLFPASATDSIPSTPANNIVRRPLVPKVPPIDSNVYKAPGTRSRQSASKFVSKFSVDTVISPIEDRPSDTYGTLAGYRSSGEGTNRRSSMVLPSETHGSPTSPDSAHSGVRGSAVNKTPLPDAGGDYLKPEAAATLSKSPTWTGHDSQRTVDSAVLTDDDDGHETVTFMLDQSSMPQGQHDQVLSQDERSRVSWHRRVGDECPTFSDRKSTGQTRIVTPPPPLLLDQPMRPRRHPAPDPVQLESPREALDQIQQQLRKLEDLDGQSGANEQQRLSLLANLEQEMGMQESRWQQMRDDLTRISVSTAISSPSTPGTNSRNISLDVSPMVRVVESNSPDSRTLGPVVFEDRDLFTPDFATTAIADQVHITRPELPPQSVPLHESKDSLPDANTDSASARRRTEAQPDSAGSPRSSASRDENNEDLEFDDTRKERYPEFVMCVPSSSSGNMEVGTPKQSLSPRSPAPLLGPQPEPERPVTRRSPVDSSLEGSRTANSEPKNDRSAPAAASSPTMSQRRPQQKATRPQTMRPPRRPKRISTLPDIVEDPQPLKGKRDTLGLFQFPWGERSDVPSIPLTFSMPPGAAPSAVIPRTAPMYPTLESQIRTLQSQKYSASFFEDYDENDEGDEDSLDSSDDDFDEATLWEIASLLKSDNVPSRESLFPGQEEEQLASASIVDDYLDGEAFLDDEASNYEPTSTTLVREAPSPTLPGTSMLWADKRKYTPDAKAHGLPQPKLTAWEGYVAAAGDGRVASRKADLSNTNTAGDRSRAQSTLTNTPSSSLPALWTLQLASASPSTALFEAIISSKEVTNSDFRDDGSLTGPCDSRSLWSPPKPAINGTGARQRMPSSPSVLKSMRTTVDAMHPQPHAALSDIDLMSLQDTPLPRLWSAPKPLEPVEQGLPQPDSKAWEEYLVPDCVNRRMRKPEPLQSLESASLWAPGDKKSAIGQPLTAAVTRTVSPGVESFERDSSESQGRSSADSDKSSSGLAELNTGLWLPSPAKLTEEPHGLFQTGNPIVYDRNAKPAAQDTRPNRRTEQKPLATIQSGGLWASPSRHSFTQDWVSLSSIRPNTPGGTSSYSGSETPRSDDSSAYSSVTGMSTVNSVFAVCPEAGSGDAAASGNSRPAESKRVLSLVPEFVSEAQWQSDNAATGTNKPDGGFTAVPLLGEFVSGTQWQATLEDAVQARELDASAAEEALVRKAHDPATPAAWATALRDALEASALMEATAPPPEPSPVRSIVPAASGFDVARHHPVFAVSVLDTSSGEIHPAASGYLTTSVNGDPDNMGR